MIEVRSLEAGNGRVGGSVGTRRHQLVEDVARTALERIVADQVMAPLFKKYWHGTRHHYARKRLPLDWQALSATVLADLASEPRAIILLEKPYPDSISLKLLLNCEEEIVKERVNGKMRSVPKASDTSTVSVAADAHFFTDPAFTVAYLALLGDMCEIIDGEYGWSDHYGIECANDFDRVRSSPFEPSRITWANFFGPELVERFGRDMVLAAPAYHIRALPSGGMVLTVCASPLEQLQPEVQARIAQVKAHLGILSPSERATPEEVATFEVLMAARQEEMKRRVEVTFRQEREQTTVEMQRQAAGCVEGVQQFWRVRLDFSPQSLAVVDRLITTRFGPNAEAETIATAVQAFGAYVGEVVRRSMGGVWHDEEMIGRPILLQVGSQKQRLYPFHIVQECFQLRQQKSGVLATWYQSLGCT